jgi:hypothetical protein
MAHAAIGFRVHSGWAVAVVVGEREGSPAVFDRRRIEIADAKILGSKQPYHAAEGLPMKQAAALIERCRKSTWSLARKALEEICRAQAVSCCGMLVAAGRPLPDLPAILASHALIHTAEGEFFRRALADAGQERKLPVRAVKEKELLEVCARELRLSLPELRQRLTEWGRALGPPWTQDEKYAALAAWLALSSDFAAAQTA